MRFLPLAVGVTLVAWVGDGAAQKASPPEPAADYVAVRPLLKTYCLNCHSTAAKKGSLDLERFATLGDVRKDLKPWQGVLEMIEAGEMPPKEKPQPTADEKKRLVSWVRGFLDAEARARVGDPGAVPLRRLSNAEYDYTVRDLTGVDLRPTRDFPADGAAGEGFTNAAEALSDVSPALLTKYLNAAKDIASHAVLLPDGVRFSPGKTRRDWANETLDQLRAVYAGFGPDGRLPLRPYLTATVRHRDAIAAGTLTVEAAAAREKLTPKYFGVLWGTLTAATPSQPLDAIRARFRRATEKDVPALADEVAGWQSALWKTVVIGSYRAGDSPRQVPNDPAAVALQSVRLAIKPAPGQSDVTVYLAASDLTPGGKGGDVVWHRPRFEAAGQPPLLLKDYATFGPAYEVDYAATFGKTADYLAAAVEAAHDRKASVPELAKKHGLDPAFLVRWVDMLALAPRAGETTDRGFPTHAPPAVAVELLDEKKPQDDKTLAVSGWRRKGTDLPMLVANAADTVALIPGKANPHQVVVHPTPAEFVAVAWKSPVAGAVRVSAAITHAHPACGNGVAWRLEHRRAGRAATLADGAVGVGGGAKPAPQSVTVEKGDVLLLAVDAKNGDHSCDLTEVALTVAETAAPNRVWNLAADVADTVLAGNPHADRHGHRDTWSFVRGPSKPTANTAGPVVPPDSLLGRWRTAAVDPARRADATALAGQVQTLLTGPRPAAEKSPDRLLYDALVRLDGPLLSGLEPGRWAKQKPGANNYGLDPSRFGNQPADEASLVVPAGSVTAVRLPAALFAGREFVVDGKTDPAADRVVQFRVLTSPPLEGSSWDAKAPVVATATGAAYKRLMEGHDEFRRCFPLFVCFPHVIPVDEVVCLKMYHREDEPLTRLFLADAERQHLDRLWVEHRFISRQAVAENDYLPQFIGFVTQDQPKELLAYFEGMRPTFRKRAEEFERDAEAAVPKQLDTLLEFSGRAYRRPLTGGERGELLGLYRTLRAKGVAHDEAFRGVLARVLVGPAFLFRVERAPAGKDSGPVDDWELATRLSYFLWSSAPDDDLRRLAAAGGLRNPQALDAQVRRMVRDDRVRRLAIEFGTQWVHVRGFDAFNEKNEKLFPTFDPALRAAIYEESVRFFQDLFQSDRPVTAVLDADYTFLNEPLAKHYGIPGVSGAEFRRVDGVRQYGRGGILGLASVQARQSGASRTSPVLRGNWVVETLLGEKLPRPPANVPRLPEEEGGADRLTTRQQVERHAADASCAVCHRRIDPFGFALEGFDAIGRRREKDLGGLAVDTHAKLKDGTEFEGVDGLRSYLLAKKKDVIVRLFCRKLLGYALGRAVALSDQSLVDEMVAELNRNDGRLSAAVLAIVRSPQFRNVRGADFAADE